MPLGVPSVFQLGLLTTQRQQLKQDFFASLRKTSSGFLKLLGEGFSLLIHMCPHSVQAGLISMKLEPIHYVTEITTKLFAHNYILATGVGGNMGNNYYNELLSTLSKTVPSGLLKLDCCASAAQLVAWLQS